MVSIPLGIKIIIQCLGACLFDACVEDGVIVGDFLDLAKEQQDLLSLSKEGLIFLPQAQQCSPSYNEIFED